MRDLARTLFEASPCVRYVASYRAGELSLTQRPGLRDASAAESDRYEELIVNPAILTLARQRGDIDCGGLRFVLIRYGRFYQLIQPRPDGHVSVALEPGCDILAEVQTIRARLEAEPLVDLDSDEASTN